MAKSMDQTLRDLSSASVRTRETRRRPASGPHSFEVGQRVMAHKSTDPLGERERYGAVTRVTGTRVQVRFDKRPFQKAPPLEWLEPGDLQGI